MKFLVKQSNGHIVLAGRNSITFLWCNKLWSFWCNSWHLFGKRWKASALEIDYLVLKLTLWRHKFETHRERMIFNPTVYFFPKCSKWAEEKHNIGTPFHNNKEQEHQELCLLKVFSLYFEMMLILFTSVRLAQCLNTSLS